MILSFNVKGQIIQRLGSPCLANDTQNYLALSFTFDEDWAEHNKYLIFTYKGKHYEFILEYDNEAEAYLQIVPKEVLKGKGFYFTIYGTKDEERITTHQVRIDLLESGYTTDITPIDYPDVDDIFERIIQQEEEYAENQVKRGLNTLTTKIRGG